MLLRASAHAHRRSDHSRRYRGVWSGNVHTGQCQSRRLSRDGQYFGSDTNRTQVRSKVYITVYENFGDRKHERISKKTITLSNQKEKRDLIKVAVEEKR